MYVPDVLPIDPIPTFLRKKTGQVQVGLAQEEFRTCGPIIYIHISRNNIKIICKMYLQFRNGKLNEF